MIEAVLNHFAGVKKNGAGWMALCPAHEDKNPSLSIREENGKVLLYCHAGCTYEAVRAAAGIDKADLNGDLSVGHAKIIDTYDYQDEAGNTLFQVVRLEPKSFKQRRPDGRGGWIWNLHGVPKVPYRLPELAAAEQVFIVEGERDVETIRGLGLVATCNPGGAGKWTSEYGQHLRGKNVVVIADNDEPGQKHALSVATSLHLIAASVKLIKALPMPEGQSVKDVTEWVSHGFTGKLLVALAADTPAWSEESTWQEAFHRISELPEGEPESIIDGYLEEGLTFLGAKSGVIKTWMGISESQALRTGEPLLGIFQVPKQRNVLYLVPEMTARRFRSRCEKLGVDIDDPGFRVRTMNDGAPLPLNDPLLYRCVESLLPVVYLDTAVRFNMGREENSSGEVSSGLITAAYQLIKLGCPMVRGLHHRAKDASDDELTLENVLRGTGDFGAAAVCVWGAAHETALRAGQLEFDTIGRRKPDSESRRRIQREYLQESKQLGRIYFELVKPGDREPLLWNFRVQLKPGVNEAGKIEILTGLALPPPDPGPQIDQLFTSNPSASVEDLAEVLKLSKTTAHRRASERGWSFDKESCLWGRIS